MSRASESLRFEIEWEPGAGIRGPELASTWARIEMWVGDDCVTRVEDIETRSARRSVYAPVYPIAEWVAYNWWLLSANVRPAAFHPAAFARPDSPQLRPWFRAHNVRSAGDGYVWPNLTVLPEGPATRMVWQVDNDRLPGAPIRYLSTGEAWVDSDLVEAALADLVEAVMTRLDEDGINDVPLRAEWLSILEADADETEFCLAAARLGLDPYSLDPSVGDSLLTAAALLDDRLLREFLEGVTPTALREGIQWLARSTAAIERNTFEPSERLLALRADAQQSVRSEFTLPWVRGWAEAKSLRKHAHLDATSRFETDDTFDVLQRRSNDSSLQALGGVNLAGGGALVVGRPLRVTDRRFAQARAIWHALGPSVPDRFLLTASSAYQPRVERAFAAELLAPAEGIREVLNGTADAVVTTHDIERVADHFGVHPFIVRHQVDNQLHIAVSA